jgi:hypothetical protein
MVLIASSGLSFALHNSPNAQIARSVSEGSTHFKMTVEVDGANAKGHVGDAVFNGSFNDGKLSLAGEFYVVEAGYTSKLDMTVSMQGELLKGTATWDIYTADVRNNPGQKKAGHCPAFLIL